MINRSAVLVAVVGAALAAAPAAALTFDAFGSFTGTAHGGAFTYGTFDGSGFTAFSDTPGCAAAIGGTTCTSDGALPAAFATTGGAHASGSVNVPADALILHPGPNAGQSAAVLFTSPFLSNYMVNFSSFVADSSPSGVNIVVFVPNGMHYTIATLSAANPTFAITTPLLPANRVAPAGFQFGFAVEHAGQYNDDSTGIDFSLTPFGAVGTIGGVVPEPASWTLLVAGFGLVGAAGRRRPRAIAAA